MHQSFAGLPSPAPPAAVAAPASVMQGGGTSAGTEAASGLSSWWRMDKAGISMQQMAEGPGQSAGRSLRQPPPQLGSANGDGRAVYLALGAAALAGAAVVVRKGICRSRRTTRGWAGKATMRLTRSPGASTRFLEGIERDTWTASKAEMQEELVCMAEHLGICKTLQVPPQKILEMVREVEGHMLANPFHNFRHVYEVTQCLYTLLLQTDIAQVPEEGEGAGGGAKANGAGANGAGLSLRLSPIEVAALWCACVCHDLEHPGHSLRLEKALPGRLYSRFSDQESTDKAFSLELHHETVAHSILVEDLGLLQALEPEEAQRFKSIVTAVIEATDLAQHGQLFKAFGEAADRLAGAPPEGKEPQSEQEAAAVRLQAMQWLMKCSDLGNTIRPTESAARWDDAVYQEFHHEGDSLVEGGFSDREDLQPNLDKRIGKRVRSSFGFYRFIVLPTYELLLRYMKAVPGMQLEVVESCVERLKMRMGHAEEMVKDSDSQSANAARTCLRTVTSWAGQRGEPSFLWDMAKMEEPPRRRRRKVAALVLLAIIGGVSLLARHPAHVDPGHHQDLLFIGGSKKQAQDDLAEGGGLFWMVPPLWSWPCIFLLGFPFYALFKLRILVKDTPGSEQSPRKTVQAAAPNYDCFFAASLAIRFKDHAPQRRRSLDGVGHGQMARRRVMKEFTWKRSLSGNESDLGSHGMPADVAETYSRSASKENLQDLAPAAADAADDAQVKREMKLWERLEGFLEPLLLCFSVVFLSVVNKVLFRMVLVPTGAFVHMLSTATNVAYLLVFWSFTLFQVVNATPERRADFKVMLRMARSNWALFASIGVCESVAFTLQPLSVPLLPKALVPILSQVLLPTSMFLNTWLLRKRYSMLNYFGVVTMIFGIALATMSDLGAESTTCNVTPVLMLVMSYVFLGFSIIFKELAFVQATNAGIRLDIFVLDGSAALGQCAALILQWPMNFALLAKLEPRAYFSAAFYAFTDSMRYMPTLLIVYWGCNVLYRLQTLKSVQHLSSLTTLFTNMFTVPFSSLVFCLPLNLPLLGASEQFSLMLVFGLLVLCLGLVIFNFAVIRNSLLFADAVSYLSRKLGCAPQERQQSEESNSVGAGSAAQGE